MSVPQCHVPEGRIDSAGIISLSLCKEEQVGLTGEYIKINLAVTDYVYTNVK